MQLTEIDFDAGAPIDGYGPDFFRVGGTLYPAPALVWPGHVGDWGGFDDPDALLALAGRVDVLLIGTGGQITHLPAPLRTPLEEAGLGVEAMDSPAAARTYNVLLSEQRRVAAALLAAGG